MVGQHALPYLLRLIVRIGPRILCLHTPPTVPPELIPDEFSNLEEKKTEIGAHKEMLMIYKELKYIADRMRDADKTSEYEDEWKYAAIVVDRFLTFAILERKFFF